MTTHKCICKTCGRGITFSDASVQTEMLSEMQSFVDFTEKMCVPGAPFKKSAVRNQIMMVRPRRLKGDSGKEVEEPSSMINSEISEKTQKPIFLSPNDHFKIEINKQSEDSSSAKDLDLMMTGLKESLTSTAQTEKYIENNVKFNIPSSKNKERRKSSKPSQGITPINTLAKSQALPLCKILGGKFDPISVPIKCTTPMVSLKSEKTSKKNAKSNKKHRKNWKLKENASTSKELSDESTNQLSQNYGLIFDKHTNLDPNGRETFKHLVKLEKLGLKEQFSTKNFKYAERKKIETEESASIDLSNSLNMDQIQEFLEN
ncbi:unnamed protein product [Blepharisma stoltei]|uniref:Uncharacterized protein n=1 Tax=Blepharisma stoltei TaxID=1481888 RepID=A0AAU9J3C0_9CILI|nr:unnamed protein product [Blepharisma stoltei]